MLIKGNNGKSAARKRQPASSSTKSARSNSVSKSRVSRDNSKAADKLDGNIDRTESTAVESEAGDRILEAPRIVEAAPGNDLPNKSVELTAITLHEPWASLIAAGKKQYETRDWPASYRGTIAIHAGRKPAKWNEHKLLVDSFRDLLEYKDCEYSSVIAIAELTDCILMTEEFISQQSPTELRCGNWQVGRYAFKLENVRPIAPIQAAGKQGLWKWSLDSWNPDDFGEVQHKADADGQLNLLEWEGSEPPDPDDYESIELFDQAYKQWEDSQQSTVNSQQPGTKLEYFCSECRTWMPRNQIKEEFFGDYQTQLCKSCLNEVYHEFDVRSPQLEIEGEKLCNQLMDGLICAAESVPASPTPESNYGSDRPTTSANGIAIAEASLLSGIPASTELPISESVTSVSAAESSSLVHLHHANPSALTENGSQPKTAETASQMYSELSEQHNQNSQLSKMSQDSSVVPTLPEINQEATSDLSSTPYRQAGTMRNGFVSGATSLPLRGVGKEFLLLRSPGALSGSTGVRPPGKTRLENQLQELSLISSQEVVAPEFLEAGYNLPIGFTNPKENRTALELAQAQAQQLPIAHKSELLLATETTAIEGKHSETPLTGESQPLDSSELTTSASLPPNIGALTKDELLSLAQEQHQIISLIERKQFELALEKLHRIYVTGVCLVEFKKKCQYGEFIEQIESRGISARSAQQYTFVAKNWETIEAKAKLVSLLPEESQPAIGLKWALETVRDEKKHLKSAAPPKDPDGWRTPDTKDQPVVSLVKKSLGGSIWLDPCSGSSSNIPAAVRYYKQDDGLAHHQTWSKTVFINPPFSDPFPWVERCCLEFARGNVSAAIMLLKAGVVSNVGTGELINKYASAICHWRGRINFLNDEGNAVKGSDFDCVFVYFGARLDLFRQAFQQRGTIATIDNHYSSVNKKFLETAPLPEPQTLKSEQKQLAAAVGLGNGRSVLPDRRDFDRELAERYDPHTVVDALSTPTMPTSTPTPVSENLFEPLDQPEVFDKTPLANRQFEKAKQNTLNDYITAISSNISEFSNDQIAFLAKIINEESAKRIDF